MDVKACYKIGYVSKTHGLKGEVTLVLTEAVVLKKAQSLFVEINGNLIPYFIESISDRGDQAFVKFEDVGTPEQAKELKGNSLYLPKKARQPLERGEFYDDEVVGFEVEEAIQGHLGTIREVQQIGPNRLLVVDTTSSREVLIPVNGPFIVGVNKSKKKIRVELPEGFLDI